MFSNIIVTDYVKARIFQTCAYSTTENTNFVKWGSRVDFGNTSGMNHSVFTERRGTNKMVNRLSLYRKSCLTIMDHDTAISVDPQQITHVALL